MILLSFDIEEFDMPLEYGKSLPFEDQMAVSIEGTQIILELLKKNDVHSTFFCTANFADHASDIIRQMVEEGHEVASHGYYHSVFNTDHLKLSKDQLERIAGQQIKGFRMPRMMPVDNHALHLAGYQYSTSVNPIFLPGRYNNLRVSRTCFKEGGVLQIPASVSPFFRIPLFWLSFHNMPLSIYKKICSRTYQADRYLNLYFHPWEFTGLGPREKYGFPRYVIRNSGDKMKTRLDHLIIWMKSVGYPFATFNAFTESTALQASL